MKVTDPTANGRIPYATELTKWFGRDWRDKFFGVYKTPSGFIKHNPHPLDTEEEDWRLYADSIPDRPETEEEGD